MSRPVIDPDMERWIAEQIVRYPPSAMDAAIQIMRSIERAKREQAQRDAA